MRQTDSPKNDDENRTSIDFERDGWTGDRELTVKHRGDVIETEPENDHYKVIIFDDEGLETGRSPELRSSEIDDIPLIKDKHGGRFIETAYEHKETVKSTEYDVVEYNPVSEGWQIAHGKNAILELIEKFCEQEGKIAIQEQVLVRVG